MFSNLSQPNKSLISVLAGLGSGLVVVSISESCVVQSTCISKVAERAIVVPQVAPIVSIESTSNQEDLTLTSGMRAKEDRTIPLNSAQIALKEAKVAVSLSQTQLAQARINLIEFQIKHNNAKLLSQRGKVSSKHVNTTKAAYELARLQHRSAEIGLQASKAQLIAAKAEVSRLGCKANSANQT